MKKILLGLLSLGIFVPAMALAADIRTSESQTLTADDVVTDDLYLFGKNIIDSGTVHGDLTAAGGSVLIIGPVDGTAQIAGGNLSLTGTVSQTVRAAGGSILINGSVGKDVIAAGGNIEIDSPIGRDVVAAGGTVTINAPISGDVDVSAGKVIIGSKASINGALIYRSPEVAAIDPGAKINGPVKYIQTATPAKKAAGPALGVLTFLFFAKFLMMLVFALLLVWLMKRYCTDLVVSAFDNPVAEFVKGFAAIILFPIVSAFLCATFIGLPIGIVGILSYVILLIISSVLAALFVGSLVYKWATKNTSYEVSWKTAVTGVIIYCLLGVIPVIGFLLKFLLVPLAFGVILKAKWNLIKTLR